MTGTPSDLKSDGKLVNLVVDNERGRLLKTVSQDLPDVVLNDRQLCDFEMLATGAFSPLTGFMNRPDYESVLDRMRLQNGQLWPVPICLAISDAAARNLEAGQSLAVRDPEGFMLAVMHVEDVWPADREKERLRLLGGPGTTDFTESSGHGGSGDHYVGGRLEVISLPLHFEFKQLRMTPEEIRKLQKKLGWQRIIGFQTRHLIHRAQYEMTVRAMRSVKANLLLLPLAGLPEPGDIEVYTRIKCHRELIRHYPPDSLLLNLLPMSRSLPGVRGRLLGAIVSRNFGCTHCLIEPEMPEMEGGDFPRQLSDADRPECETAEEIGLTFLPFEQMAYLPYEDEYCPMDRLQENVRSLSMTDHEIRDRIRSGRRIPDWAAFPEVVTELQKAYPPPGFQGFTIFLTGFSGAGKSTVAKILYSRFLEIGGRPVTLLDGDIVRRNLSSELKFSKEHRDINVRRIGFVASEITKNRGIAICAPIAPYTATRREIRKSIETWGGFIEVHMATPIDVCEKRDRKGMYAKARAGLIRGFTGVDDPYEVPRSPEIRIDTTDLTPDEAAQEILLFLGQKGFI